MVLLRFGQFEEILHVMEHVISILCYINRSHDRYLYMKFSIENKLILYGLLVRTAAEGPQIVPSFWAALLAIIAIL